MIYVFVLLFCSSYFYAFKDKDVDYFYKFIIINAPVLFLLFIFPAFQLDVGSDYYTYKNIYHYPDYLDIFERKSEYIFIYLYEIAINLKLGDQFVFIFSSFVNSLSLLFIIFKLKKHGYKEWLVFFIFFTVTGIYNNQMNGLRQYVVIMLLPISVMLFFDFKYIKFTILLFLSRFVHTFAMLELIIIPIYYFNKSFSVRFKIFSFFIMPIIVIFISGFIDFLVVNYIPIYAHYLDSDYSSALSITSILSKLIYLPLFFLFFYLWDKNEIIISDVSSFFVSIFIITYWVILISLKFGFGYRISTMFIFFYIFPIYHLVIYFLSENKISVAFLLILYLFVPYFTKVVLFPVGEFDYNSIIF